MDGQGDARRLSPAFAEEVRVLLARRRISAVQLAKAMGVSQPYLSRRLNGAVTFSLDDLDQLAEVLDIDPVEFLPRRAARPDREHKHPYISVGHSVVAPSRSGDPSAGSPIGPRGRTDQARPRSAGRRSTKRPANARPAVLPRPA